MDLHQSSATLYNKDRTTLRTNIVHAVLDHSEALNNHTITFWFNPEEKLRFEPGQYVELSVPHSNVDNRGVTRWMSLSSTPAEPLLGVTTAFPAKSSSYKQALHALQPGDAVQFGSVLGDFILPKDRRLPLIFIVGGIGAAPVRSMIAWLKSQGEQRHIELLYSAGTRDELIFNDLFSSYVTRYTPSLTKSTPDWTGQTGRLTSSRVMSWISDHNNDALTYLSGPQGLIEPLFNELIVAGIPRAQLVLDYFPGY